MNERAKKTIDYLERKKGILMDETKEKLLSFKGSPDEFFRLLRSKWYDYDLIVAGIHNNQKGNG